MTFERVFPALVLQLAGLLLTVLVLDQFVMFKCFVAGCLLYWFYFLYKTFLKIKQSTIDTFLLRFGPLVFFSWNLRHRLVFLIIRWNFI